MIKSYTSLAGLRLLSFGLAAAFLAIVAGAVPAAEFGRYSLVLSVVLVIGSGLLSFGNPALLRFAREEYTASGLVGRALATRLVAHAGLTLVVLTALWLLHPLLSAKIGVPSDSLGLMVLALLLVPLNEMATFAAQSVNRYTGYGIGPVILRLAQLASVTLIYVLAVASWKILMIGTLAGYGLCAILSWSRVPRRAIRNLRPSLHEFRRFGNFSWSLPIASMSVVLMDWMDLWFIQYFLGTASVGVYAWVYNISLMARALLTPLGALVAPRLIDLSVTKDTAALARIVRVSQSLVLLVIALIPGIVGLFIVALGAVDLGDYQAGIAPAMILIAAGAFQFGVTFWYPMILAQEQLVARGTLVLLLGAALNAAGNWLLIPLLAAPGAAFATALAICFNMMGFILILRRCFAIKTGPSLPAMAAFGAVMLTGVAVAAFLPVTAGASLCFLTSAVSLLTGRRLAFYNGLSELNAVRAQGAKSLTRRTLAWLNAR